MKFRFSDPRHLSIAILYAGIVSASLIFACLLRFDFAIPSDQVWLLSLGLVLALPIKMASFLVGRLHRPIWRFATAGDLLQLLVVNVLASLAFAAAFLLARGSSVPPSIFLIDFLICFVLSGAARFAPQIYSEAIGNGYSRAGGKGILIYGAGVAGTMLVREIRNNPRLGYNLLGFLDDDLSKRDATLMGVPVLGTGRDAARIVELFGKGPSRVQEIVIAIPSVNASQMQEVLANCRAAGVSCKTIPSHSELISGKIRNAQSDALSVEDLLGRDPVHLDEDRIRPYVSGRCVLVTGAAGSIGSELCRQIARFWPARLIAFRSSGERTVQAGPGTPKEFPVSRSAD